jgi:4'-phosphopantetheinyl transferase
VTDAVTVWWARPDQYRTGHLSLLDEVESARREALRQPADRDRFTVAAAALRLACARLTGLDPRRVPVDRGCERCGQPHGRPRISGYDLHVSISHSGERVAVATATVPVGVDVEQIRPIPVDEIGGQVLGPDEHAGDLPGFFTYWARKESAVKATGDGLTVALSGVLVSAPDQPARLLGYRTRPELVATMADLSPGPGYAAALTLLTARPGRVTEQDAGELLNCAD